MKFAHCITFRMIGSFKTFIASIMIQNIHSEYDDDFRVWGKRKEFMATQDLWSSMIFFLSFFFSFRSFSAEMCDFDRSLVRRA